MPGAYHPDLLLLASALTGRPVHIRRKSRQGAGRLLQAARDHGVAPLLSLRSHAGTLHGLSEEDRKTLSADARANAVSDLMLNAATRRTLDLLAAADIPVLLLKGTPIAFLYYGDTYLRVRCDTDLFIRAADTQATADLLASEGYRISGLGQRPYASKQFGATLSTNAGCGTFDIHWKLSNRISFHHVLRFDECWESRRPLPDLGSNAYTLSPLHLLIHACLHRIAHGGDLRNRLLWLHDIHLIASAFSAEELEQLQQLVLEKKVGTLCQDALAMCQYYFRTRYPTGYLTALSKNRRREPTSRLLQASKPKWALADLRRLKTPKAKLAFAGELLFPPHLAAEPGVLPWLRAWTAHVRSRMK